mgnify:CR=1 FL=1
MYKCFGLLILGACGAFLGFTGDATATPRVRVVSCNQHYQAQVVNHAAYVATPYYQPIYSIGFQPDVTALAEEIKGLRQDFLTVVQQLQQGPGQPQALKEHPGAKLMRQDCARCHDGSVAKSKGRGVILFKDGAFIDTPENVEAVVEQVDSGRMPKDKKWNGEEKYVFLSYHTLRPKDAPSQPEPKVEQLKAEPKDMSSQVDKLILERLDLILKKKTEK